MILDKSLKSRMALTTAVLAVIGSYSRRAYAAGASCASAGGIYSCTGTYTTTRTLSGPALNVTTASPLSVITTSGDGFDLTGTGGLRFNDSFASTVINGKVEGIKAANSGGGAVSITTSGAVTGGTYGIFANNSVGTAMTITTGAVTGGSNGIFAKSLAGTALSITSTGTVTGTSGIGIYASNSFGLGTLTINAAAVSGGTIGISAKNSSNAAQVLITSTGTVTGGTGAGIYVSNGISSSILNITTAAVSGSTGILVKDAAPSSLTIVSNGAVTGTSANGIYALMSSTTGTNLTISTATVSGGTNGIFAKNSGAGALSITSTGTVTGTSANGIYANNGKGVLSINAATVSGRTYGINAYKKGLGADLTINAGAVSGGSTGIRAVTRVGNALSITSTGTVTGTSANGINAHTYLSSGNLTITAAAVSGGTNGIYANSGSNGVLSITSTGTVTGTSARGIYANNSGTGGIGGTDVTISTAAVSGKTDGIFAQNAGTGALSITSTGTVTGTSASGINAYIGIHGTDLTISTAAVYGGSNGILAKNLGTGALSITATGTVTGNGTAGNTSPIPGPGVKNAGIYATNTTAALGDLTVNVATVAGGAYGIKANNYGAGALSIKATGQVTGLGTYDSGIQASNNKIGAAVQGSSLTINVADVSGGIFGIHANNYGTGALSVTASGTVTGASGDGILAVSTGSGQTINTSGSVTGGFDGINANNLGGGDLSVTTTGAVTGGTDGIYANNASTSGGLAITTGAAVTGTSGYGIDALNTGSAGTTITVNTGSVVQGGVAGIFVDPVAPITINNAGTIQNLSGASDALAIKTAGAVTTITNTGTITGTVALGDLGNTFSNSGTWNTAGGSNTFGAGTNNLTNLAGGTIIAASAGSTSAQTTSFNNVGTFTNAGLLSLQNGIVGDKIVVQGNFVGNGGTVALDTDNTSVDQLVIDGGKASGTTLLKIVSVGSGAQITGNGIPVVVTENGATISADTVFRLSGTVAAGAYQYQLFPGGDAATGGDPNDQNWYLRDTLIPTLPDNSDSNTDGNTDSNTSGTTGNTQTPPPPTGPQLPNYRTEVPVYLAMPELANTVSLAMIGTYDTRMGSDGEETGAASNPDQQPMIWGRLLGAAGQQKPGNQNGLNTSNDFLNGKGPSYAYAYGGLQLGMDLWRKASSDGSHDHVGAYGGYLHANADVDQVYDVAGTSNDAGRLDMDAYSLGAYWTHFGATGWYSDVVMQGTWFGNIKGQSANTAMSVQGSAFTASGEVGYPFHFDGGWTLEPQGQIIYQHQSLDSGADLYGLTSFNDTNDVRGRIGAKLSHGVLVGEGSDATPLTAWVRANLWHDFAVNDPSATFANLSGANPVTLNGSFGGSWAEIDAGISGHLTQSISLSGSVFYDHAIDGAQSWSAGGSAGIKSTGVKIGAVIQF